MTEIEELTDQLYETATEWLESQISKFDPLVYDSGPSRMLRRKAFAELALVVYTSEQLDVVERPSGFDTLLFERSNDRRYHELLLRHPERVRLYGPPLTYTHALGELGSAGQQVLTTTLERDATWAKERRPYAMMDMAHLCKLAGRPDLAPDMETVLEFGSIRNPPHVVESELETIYGLTHCVLFWHHFGLEHPEFPTGPAPDDTDTRYRGLILRFLAADNFDIALELLLCGVLQRAVSPTTVGLVLESLADVSREKGYIPGPDVDGGGLVSMGLADELETDDSALSESEYHWKKNYHTNILTSAVCQIIRSQWGEFVRQTTRDRHDCTVTDVVELGAALDALAKYDLKRGARQLSEIAGTPVCEVFPGVVADAVQYLERQCTEDGHFGHWTDERLLFDSEDRSGSFEETLVAPLSERCKTAIATIEYEGEPASQARSDTAGN